MDWVAKGRTKKKTDELAELFRPSLSRGVCLNRSGSLEPYTCCMLLREAVLRLSLPLPWLEDGLLNCLKDLLRSLLALIYRIGTETLSLCNASLNLGSDSDQRCSSVPAINHVTN